jgi:hypothetical protein
MGRRRQLKRYRLQDVCILREGQKPKIIRYCRFSKHQDPDNYYRELVMLFYPWRVEHTEVEGKNFLDFFSNSNNLAVVKENCRKYNSLGDVNLTELYNEFELNRREEEERDENMKQLASEETQDSFLNAFEFDDTVVRPNIMMEIGEEAAGVDNVRLSASVVQRRGAWPRI